jgi:hypothetical protein
MTVQAIFTVEYWLDGDPKMHVQGFAVSNAPDLETAREWARLAAVKRGAVRTVVHQLSGPPRIGAAGFHISHGAIKRPR